MAQLREMHNYDLTMRMMVFEAILVYKHSRLDERKRVIYSNTFSFFEFNLKYVVIFAFWCMTSIHCTYSNYNSNGFKT